MKDKAKLPGAYTSFRKDYPGIAEAYDRFGEACRAAGPLGPREQALVKLGLSIGAGMEGAVHSHARKALEAGVTAEELRHAVLMGMTTIGFPATMRARSWVEDVLRAR